MTQSLVHTLLSSSLLLVLLLLLGLSIRSMRHDRYWPMVALVFCLGVQLLQAVLSMSDFYLSYPVFMHAGTWLLFANGPATWLMLQPAKKRTTQYLWHFVPCLLGFVWLLSFYGLDSAAKPQAYYGVGNQKMLFWLLFLLHWSGYVLWSVFSQLNSQVKATRLFSLTVTCCAAYLLCSLLTWLALVISGEYLRGLDLASLSCLAVLVFGITLLHVSGNGQLIPAVRPEQQPADFQAKLARLVAAEAIHQQADLNLQQLANRLGCSSRTLSAWFSQSEHGSFKRWLNQLRVDEARGLIIAEPETQLSVIGYTVGFNSSATFYRVFQQITGQSPGAYRKQQHHH